MADITDTGAEVAIASDSFILQVLSPSPGVSGPITFPGLPTATTVKQLKKMIRDALPSKPSDETQRLIHRGRLLAAENDSMLDIFGQDALRSSEVQSVHLVLRPADSAPTPAATTTSPAVGLQAADASSAALPNSHAAGIPNGQLPPPLASLHHLQQTVHNNHLDQLHLNNQHLQQQLLPSMQRLHELQAQGQRLHQELLAQQQRYRGHLAEGRQNSPVPGSGYYSPTQNGMLPGGSRPLQPLSAMPAFQNIVGQAQRDRSAMAVNGEQQDNRTATPQLQTHTFQHIPIHGQFAHHHHGNQADHTRTFRQEGVGPNGERWQVTVNETTTVVPNHQFSHSSPAPSQDGQLVRDVQNVLSNADLHANRAQHTRQVIPQTAHGETPQTLVNLSATASATPSAETAPILSPSTEQSVGATAVPAGMIPPIIPTTADAANSAPMVYILSSPSGPRALLMNGSESFYSPRPRHRAQPAPNVNAIQARLNNINSMVGGPQLAVPNTGVRNMAQVRNQRVVNPIPGTQPAAAVQPAQNGAPNIAPRPVQNRNDLAGQILPHLWLIVRLSAFVWFFLSGNSSWWRYTSIIGIAVIVFLANTGIFNGPAAQIWEPARRHLEALLPLAPAHPAGRPAAPLQAIADVAPVVGDVAAGNQAQAARPARRAEPDPAEVAARLLEQRRQQDTSWLMTQVRRIEHAMLLFFASLVPGVGERHIMARVEQENAALEFARARRAAEEEERLRTEGEASNEAAEAEAVAASETPSADPATVGESTGVETGPTEDASTLEHRGSHAHPAIDS